MTGAHAPGVELASGVASCACDRLALGCGCVSGGGAGVVGCGSSSGFSQSLTLLDEGETGQRRGGAPFYEGADFQSKFKYTRM